MLILFESNISFVETNSETVRDLAGNRLKPATKYLRWRLLSSPEECWEKDVATSSAALMTTVYRGMLAQGFCIKMEPTEELQSDIIVEMEERKKYYPDSRTEYVKIETFSRAYRNHQGAAPELLIEGYDYRHQQMPWMTVPGPRNYEEFTLWILGVSVPQNEIMRDPRMRSYLAMSSSITGMFAYKNATGRLMHDERIVNIRHAAMHDLDIVRWSAANAICGLKFTHGILFEEQHKSLLNDRNPWTRAAASETEWRQKNQRCGGSTPRYANFDGTTNRKTAKFLKGSFFNDNP